MMIAGGIIGAKLPEVVFVASGINTTNPINTVNFTNRSFGDEHPSRQIIVLVYGINSNLVIDQNYTTSVTVGGVSATRKVQPSGNALGHSTAWITPRLDDGGPEGTTGTITVQRSTGNGFSEAAMVAFAAYDLRESDPYDFGFGSGAPSTTALDLQGGGVLTALAHSLDEIPTFSWTGADVQSNDSGGVGTGSRWSAALLNKTPRKTAHTVVADNGLQSGIAMLAVSWR